MFERCADISHMSTRKKLGENTSQASTVFRYGKIIKTVLALKCSVNEFANTLHTFRVQTKKTALVNKKKAIK